MTHFFFSPHPDDAALSCGGQIVTLRQAGERVVIVTTLAGDPPAGFVPTPFVEELWARWGLGSGAAATRNRRNEDQAAAAVLGAEIKFLNYPEAIYRGHYPDVKAIFGTPTLQDMVSLFTLLTNDATSKHTVGVRGTDTIHLPLGVGGHVDHLITGALGTAFKRIRALVYYEDYPYSRDRALIETTLRQRFREQTVYPITHAIDDPALDAKIRAIGCYTSQLSSFWPDAAAMSQGVRDYTREVGGEREWTLNPPAVTETR